MQILVSGATNLGKRSHIGADVIRIKKVSFSERRGK